ncbi:MAG: RagB/SusD family nutrient uptake outer membrane protein [Prolixibacteraceae bacterium]|jgi:hypothetical protein|nr:RagB/SusD family nutrient uptake outer membrane protein [Prolixibacteraceae bacterium]
MKKYIINNKVVVALLMLVLMLPACNDYLTIVPENDLIEEKFWTKKEDVDAALAATYDAFRDAALKSFILGEVRADLAIFDPSLGNINKIASSDISSTNSEIKWEQYYIAINLANTLMLYANDVVELDNSFTNKMKSTYDSEALFIRALSYFYLVRIWKQVPLITKATTTDQGELFLGKSSEKEVITQIIADLLIAKEIALKNEFQDMPNYYKGRANIYSIMALLADVYLWNEQYEECSESCDYLIESGKFELENYNNWFNLYNPGNSMKESIFEIQFDDSYDSQDNPIYGDIIPTSGSVKITPSPSIGSLYSTQDLRQEVSPVWKYLGISFNSNTKRKSTQRDANFIYYRYADVLLMKAEALTELNQLSEANAFLRLTKERAGLTHADILKQSDLRTEVLNEKAREFIFEGKRWFDLLRAAKRNGFQNKQIIINMILGAADIKQQAILRTRVYDTMSYYLPVPENEITYNPNLDQNPFYDR